MRLKREKAQSILEYVILFGALSVLAGVTLIAVFDGSGRVQNALKVYLGG